MSESSCHTKLLLLCGRIILSGTIAPVLILLISSSMCLCWCYIHDCIKVAFKLKGWIKEGGSCVKQVTCPDALHIFLKKIILLLKYYYSERNTYYSVNVADTAWRKCLVLRREQRVGAGQIGLTVDGVVAYQLILAGPVVCLPLITHSCHYTEWYAIIYIKVPSCVIVISLVGR